MSTVTHTPTPWHVEDDMIFDERCMRIADCWCDDQDMTDDEVEANASFIVTACNAYPLLIEACEAIVEQGKQRFGGPPTECPAYRLVLKAIAATRGGAS